MDQRLRLVQGNIGRSEKRAADRQPISVRGQIVWKDARGSTQVTSALTRVARGLRSAASGRPSAGIRLGLDGAARKDGDSMTPSIATAARAWESSGVAA